MTSLIKVDSIQTSSGGIPTASSLGIGGTIGQVVSSTQSSNQSTTSTSYVTSNHSVTITPSSTSSKILVSVLGGGTYLFGTNYALYATIYRGGSNIGVGGDSGFYRLFKSASGELIGPMCMYVLDSPSTTSATTYTAYYRSENGTTAYYNLGQVGVTMTAMEVLA